MKKPKIIIQYNDKKNSSGKVQDGIICLSISSRLSPQEKEEHIKKLTEKLQSKIDWAKRYQFTAANDLIKEDHDLWRLADTINKTYYNLPLEKASFHKQKSTWGTCSLKTKQIYISQRLVGAPLEVLWYVVTHEICHLAEPGHNIRFWNLVSKACPNYQHIRSMLKAYGLQTNPKGEFPGK